MLCRVLMLLDLRHVLNGVPKDTKSNINTRDYKITEGHRKHLTNAKFDDN